MLQSKDEFIAKLKKTHGICHLLYILSPDSDMANRNYLLKLLEPFSQNGIKVAIHLFLKDRNGDTEDSFLYLIELEKSLKDLRPFIYVATLSGDYYIHSDDALFDTIIKGEAPRFSSTKTALLSSYKNKIYDNFMAPVTLGDYRGIFATDGIYFANFLRKDTEALIDTLKINRNTRPILTASNDLE